MTACFTGHRPNKLKGYNAEDNKKLLWEIHNTVVYLIENKEVTTFINVKILTNICTVCFYSLYL